jgi:hypothetical protein
VGKPFLMFETNTVCLSSSSSFVLPPCVPRVFTAFLHLLP